MNKWQDDFYTCVGSILRQRLEEKKLTYNRVAVKSGQQYNTIKQAMEGKPFQFHQASWIMEVLGLSIDEVIEKATHQVFKEEFYGEETGAQSLI